MVFAYQVPTVEDFYGYEPTEVLQVYPRPEGRGFTAHPVKARDGKLQGTGHRYPSVGLQSTESDGAVR